jgi:putative ABC transport system permease protein
VVTSLSEFKHVLRALRRDAGFTAIVVLTLALGIGGNAAILGVANTTFFGRLPFSESNRILRLLTSYRRPDGSISTVTVRGREFNVLEKLTASAQSPFSAIVGLEDANVTLTGVNTPERLTVLHTTPGWVNTMGVKPILGRWFSADEERRGEDSGVVVIAHELWLLRFGGDAGAIGKAITLDGRNYVIIGVMPQGFRFPYDGEAWIPAIPPDDLRRDYCVFARLKPGVTVQTAEAALASASMVVKQQYPDTAGGLGFAHVTLLENLQDNQQKAALALVGIAGFFLLLACVNVANLVLARSVTKQREEGIRAALGATRWQLARRRLMESFVLGGMGTCAGLLMAVWMQRWLDILVPSNFTRQLGLRPQSTDWRVLLATAVLGIVAAILCGLIPVLKSSRNLDLVIGQSHRIGRSLRERRLMDAFVVAQFTIALALLAGAGLMIRNFGELTHRDLGIDAPHLLTLRVAISASRYATPESKRTLVKQLIEKVESTPGVEAAGITSINPLGGGTWWAPVVAAGGETDSAGTSFLVNHRLITPDLQRAMGIPLLRGRLFNERDTENSVRVVLVSLRLAQKLWPHIDAVGQRVRINRAGQPWLTVIGVVGDVLDSRNPGEPKETWYLPYAQFADTPAAGNIYLMVRSGSPGSVDHAIEQAVWRVDRNLAISDNSRMDRYYLQTLSQDRLSAITISLLATFGLLLGALGIYGTLSLAVGERFREIGTRMALGAGRGEIQRLLLAHGMKLALFAAALGLASAWVVGRVLINQLSQVSPADPIALAAAASLLLLVAAVAIYLPARRAAAVDPIVALKQE